jgi:hypothetical protein
MNEVGVFRNSYCESEAQPGLKVCCECEPKERGDEEMRLLRNGKARLVCVLHSGICREGAVCLSQLKRCSD